MPPLRPQVGHWSNYPMTVARRLARNFGPLSAGRRRRLLQHAAKGRRVEHVERAHHGGRSSCWPTSTSFATAPALPPRFPTTLHLAGYLGCIENGSAFGALEGDEGVGTAGGSEDHTAIVLSQAGQLTWYRYHPVTPERTYRARPSAGVRGGGQRHRGRQDRRRAREVQPRVRAGRRARVAGARVRT